MHFQYTVFEPLDEFHGFIQICYYECPHISGIYLESLLNSHKWFNIIFLSNKYLLYLGLVVKEGVGSKYYSYNILTRSSF